MFNRSFLGAAILLASLPTQSWATVLEFNLSEMAGATVNASEHPWTVLELDLTSLTSIQSVWIEWSAYMNPGLVLGEPEAPQYWLCNADFCPTGLQLDNRQLIVQPVGLDADLIDYDSRQNWKLSSDTWGTGFLPAGKTGHNRWPEPYWDGLLATSSLAITLSTNENRITGPPYLRTIAQPTAHVLSAKLVVVGTGPLDAIRSCRQLAGDVDQDCDVDESDLDMVRGYFGADGFELPADVDGNGHVDLKDYQFVRARIGTPVAEPTTFSLVLIAAGTFTLARVLATCRFGKYDKSVEGVCYS